MTNTMVESLVVGAIALGTLLLLGFIVWMLLRSDESSPNNDDTRDCGDLFTYQSVTKIRHTPNESAEPPQNPTAQEAMPMPTTEARYKTLERVKGALNDAGLDESVVSTVVSAYEAANPSAFSDESSLSDAEFRRKTVEFTRRHLRRFPRTQSALALSLRALAKGETTSYIK